MVGLVPTMPLRLNPAASWSRGQLPLTSV